MESRIVKLKPVVKRKYVLLISELIIDAHSKTQFYKKTYFGDYYASIAYCDKVYYNGINVKEFCSSLLEREKKENFYFDKVFNNFYKIGDSLIKLSKNINKKSYTKAKWSDIKNDFDNFVYQYQLFTLAMLNYHSESLIESLLKKILVDRSDIEKDLHILISPDKENIYSKKEKSLLKLGLQLKKNNSYQEQTAKFKKGVKSFLKKYAWLYNHGGEGKLITEEDVFNQVFKLGPNFTKKLSEKYKIKKGLKKESNRLIKELKLNEKEKRIISIAKEMVYFRTYRTDYLNWSFFNIRPLLSIIAKKLNLTLSQVLYSRISELSQAEPALKKILKRRKNNYFIMNYNKDEIIFSDEPDEIKKLSSKYLDRSIEKIKNIKGRVAFSGKVKSRVCVIKEKKDFKKMKKGLVLVTAMTTPDFIQLMNMASAILTDEGGITCHAAIVSRELKKPCIIGTNIATKILKDGDLVEVDANKGMVTVLKRR